MKGSKNEIESAMHRPTRPRGIGESEMQTDQSSQNSGNEIPKIFFIVLIGLVGLGAVSTYAVNAIRESRRLAAEDRSTFNLCRTMALQILADAKSSAPEVGTYEASLETIDSWDQPLTSVLVVEELHNTVSVRSLGRDSISGTEDDHSYRKTDVHIRKSILNGIVAGSHSAGKGLTSGVIEGLSKAKDASLIKAKEGVRKVKTSLMSRFKRKEKSNGNG